MLDIEEEVVPVEETTEKKPKKPTKKKKDDKGWAKKPKITDLKHDLEQAQTHHSEFVTNLDRWQQLYDAPKRPKHANGGSRIQPKLIRKQNEWRCPALSEPFLSTTNLFDIKPLTHEDAERARQNSLILNRQFNTQLDKVNLVDGVIRKVAKEGTCITRTGWASKEIEVDEEVTEYEYTPVINPELMEQAQQEHQQLSAMREHEPDSYEQIDDAEKAAFEMSEETGQLLMAEAVGTTTQKVTKLLYNKPTVEICNSRNVYIDPTCKGNPDNAKFIIYSYESSISELKKDKNFKNIDKIAETEGDADSFDHDDNSTTNGFRFADKARKKLVVYEYWGEWDVNDDGTTKPIVVCWVGTQIIRMDDNPYPDKKPPFTFINYIPEEDSVYGIPDAELLEDNQEILGATMRGVIDIMGKSANAQTGYAKNFLDVSNQIKFNRGEDYMFNPGFDPRMHMHQHTFGEIPNSALSIIQMTNNEAESMSGVKAFGQDGLNAVNFGDTAVGVRGVLDAVSKREMSVLRRISDGFVRLGRKVISMNAEFLSEEEVVRVTNSKFIKVRRDDLGGNYDVTLTISTAEADDAKAQELAFILQTIGDSMGAEIKQLVLADIARLRKLPELAEKIETYAPEPDPMQQKMQELEIAKLEAEIAVLQADAAEAQAKAQVHTAKIDVENARAQDIQGSANKKALDFVDQDSGKAHQQSIEKQDAQVEGNLAMQDAKAQAALQQQAAGHNQAMLGKHADAELAPPPAKATESA